MKFIEDNSLYLILIGGFLSASVILHLYVENRKNIELNRELNNAEDFNSYILLNLEDIFTISSYYEIPDQLLKFFPFQHLMKQISLVYLESSQFLFYLDGDIRVEVNNFLNFLKTNPSYKEISDYKISKRALFNLIASIKRQIFCIEDY